MNCMVTCMYSLTNYWQTCTNDCIRNNITFDNKSYAHPNMITMHSLCSSFFEFTGSCNSHRIPQFAALFVGCRTNTYVATCKDVNADTKPYPVIYKMHAYSKHTSCVCTNWIKCSCFEHTLKASHSFVWQMIVTILNVVCIVITARQTKLSWIMCVYLLQHTAKQMFVVDL